MIASGSSVLTSAVGATTSAAQGGPSAARYFLTAIAGKGEAASPARVLSRRFLGGGTKNARTPGVALGALAGWSHGCEGRYVAAQVITASCRVRSVDQKTLVCGIRRGPGA
jgi:hypothetical protein